MSLKLEMKKLGFFDRALFILGLTLAGVIVFVFAAGVVVALLKMYFDLKKSVKANTVNPRKDISNTFSTNSAVWLDQPQRENGSK